ncbi:RagB/SusD family nutrient uptake outer membrane protein [Echinicola vietnamensis]|uniref:RagB/SusD family protein n=1 Tax=Echinicola vietnamensis (strain DSM 17526 / LMG 23754 / KMM 6221) TaxID=926556 RepID=L0G714_ECHVK|nr:RagB/SusD family nutrient uptake outer membrane protein [Echinicola vietnamensis]AGA80806.1 RagB/SusD family protein [Echinicola vietnamensis DSM 17526]
MKLNRLIYTLGLSLMLVSCSEDFLETDSTEFISRDRLDGISETDPSVQLATLRGIYSTMYLTGTGGTTGHDDFGQRGYDIFSDMLSTDMVLGAKIYGWYSQISDLQVTIDYTNNRNYMVWRYYYRVIYAANSVIDALGGTAVVPESDEAKLIMAQAKTMRAYAYFYLANFFAEEYNPTEEILPIYVAAVAENVALSSTEQVYQLILDDLNTSIEYFGEWERANLYEVDGMVARGLLSYVYSAMGEYQLAADNAQYVIDNGGFPLLTREELTTNGFNSVESPGWIWGVDITNQIGLDLISWWGQVDLFTYSYAWAGDPKIINDDLYNAIPEEDGRKGQFVDAYGDGQLWPLNKFFAPDRVVGGQRTIESDYLYMRIEEMYLLHAENAAKAGDEAAARASLKALMEERVPDASYVDALAGQALLDEIILQTRIELWGEGKSYLMMKRNRLTVTLASNHLTYPGQEVPFNDDRLTFDIPQSEIQNNPFIEFQ